MDRRSLGMGWLRTPLHRSNHLLDLLPGHDVPAALARKPATQESGLAQTPAPMDDGQASAADAPATKRLELAFAIPELR